MIEININKKNISGIAVRTNNENEKNPLSAKIPGLWNEFMMKNVYEKIPYKGRNNNIIALYTDYESDCNGEYTLLLGTEVIKQDEKKYINKGISEGKYLSFNFKGKFPNTVILGWQEVWRFFEENPGIKRAYTTDYEEYLSEEELNINISLLGE